MSAANRITGMDLPPRSVRFAIRNAPCGAGAAAPGRRMRISEANRINESVRACDDWSMERSPEAVP